MKNVKRNTTGTTIQKPKLSFYGVSTDERAELPLVEGGIKAGFPSPADDFLDLSIDINKEYIRNKGGDVFCEGERRFDEGCRDERWGFHGLSTKVWSRRTVK